MRPFHKLFNAGTSEGVKKGWEARRGNADQLSVRSEDAGAKATRTGKPSDHQAAAKLHYQTATEFNKLAGDAREQGSGVMRQRFEMDRRGAHHEDKGDLHARLASEKK